MKQDGAFVEKNEGHDDLDDVFLDDLARKVPKEDFAMSPPRPSA